MAELLTGSDYAIARGVNPSAIYQAVKKGQIRLVDGKVDPDEADATWYRRHLQRQDGRRSGAEAEARREQAVTQSTAAKMVMTRKKAETMREVTIDRDKSQAEIGGAATEAENYVFECAALDDDLLEAIAVDLGDLQLEALRVTR